MNAGFLHKFIEDNCALFDIIVLKGFSPRLIAQVAEYYCWLDSYVVKDGRIVLENINGNRLMMAILSKQAVDGKLICTCESFIKLCTQITGLDILQKHICILENNFLDLYPNPTCTNIPDFDSEDFQDTEDGNALYSAFYSYCINEDDEQWVQYIDNYSTNTSCVTRLPLAAPLPFSLPEPAPEEMAAIQVSTKDGSLNRVMKHLYEEMKLATTHFSVEAEELNDERIRIFIQAGKMTGNDIHISIVSRNLEVAPRVELFKTLNRVWGYSSFRQLSIYKDLSQSHNTVDISQGSVVETVVRQAEHAYYGEAEKVSNILLTAPTGAGKSLLFQLSAIYLAEKYGLLTLVISPLVALMNDQVEGLTGYKAVATLNSNKTAAEKAAILQGVRNGSVNMLYLAPELLLSYSIHTFIGERKLGLLVVDEAHTVTTWGRDFRVDYWFLGDYLRKARRHLKYQFPIFALTATAVWAPNGRNDMVFDTIRSLNMDPCIKFIGVVRRTNIKFEIEASNITTNYEEKRKQLTVKRIREAITEGKKTIVYFPFRRTVDAVAGCEELEDLRHRITRFHANLFPEEKTLNAELFRKGERLVMCATKAFGMGIDVSDIEEVYHHAPTGCLSDYVQEIGRLARDPKITGVAKIDFSPGDFRYIRKLHGLSAIKPYQLQQVLKKLMAVYRMNGEKRNMLISASDFSYIFPLSTPDGLDQNLKSCLLLLSNDLLAKLRFHAIIVRPKSLFSKCYVEVPLKESKDFYRTYHEYLRHITDKVFLLDADRFWTEKYHSISFPQFKSKLAEGKIFCDFHATLRNQLTLCLHDTVAKVRAKVEEFFLQAHKFLDEMSTTHRRIDFVSMKSALPRCYDSQRKEQFVETFRMLYATSVNNDRTTAYCSVFSFEQTGNTFQLLQSGYESVMHLYLSQYDKLISTHDLRCYCDSHDDIVRVSEFLNSLGVADYRLQGGDEPVIFVRINNPYYLSTLVRSKNYENRILNDIYEKYRLSERIFTYFFSTPMTDQQRWDFIEAYFLGETEEKLLNFIQQ